jgi:hypothetical protein
MLHCHVTDYKMSGLMTVLRTIYTLVPTE